MQEPVHGSTSHSGRRWDRCAKLRWFGPPCALMAAAPSSGQGQPATARCQLLALCGVDCHLRDVFRIHASLNASSLYFHGRCCTATVKATMSGSPAASDGEVEEVAQATPSHVDAADGGAPTAASDGQQRPCSDASASASTIVDDVLQEAPSSAREVSTVCRLALATIACLRSWSAHTATSVRAGLCMVHGGFRQLSLQSSCDWILYTTRNADRSPVCSRFPRREFLHSISATPPWRACTSWHPHRRAVPTSHATKHSFNLSLVLMMLTWPTFTLTRRQPSAWMAALQLASAICVEACLPQFLAAEARMELSQCS